MASLNFNTAGKDAMDDFKVLPAAPYNVQITKSEIKPTKKGDGKRLNFTMKVLDGKFKGRVIFAGLNVENPNQEAVDLSMKELTSICNACGVGALTDTTVLHNIPLRVTLKIKPAAGGYDEQNQITKYEKYGGGVAVSNQAVPDFVEKASVSAASNPAIAAQLNPVVQQAPTNQQEAQTQQAPAQQAPVQQQEQVAQVAQAEPATQQSEGYMPWDED